MSNGSSRQQIYIVDDDDAVRESMRALLEALDFDVADFGSAQEFLANQESRRDGCLLLDLHMPVMSGIDLLEHMQTHGLHIPTIVITGRSDSILKDRALRLGALELMDKPVSDDALLDAIGRALGTPA